MFEDVVFVAVVVLIVVVIVVVVVAVVFVVVVVFETYSPPTRATIRHHGDPDAQGPTPPPALRPQAVPAPNQTPLHPEAATSATHPAAGVKDPPPRPRRPPPPAIPTPDATPPQQHPHRPPAPPTYCGWRR